MTAGTVESLEIKKYASLWLSFTAIKHIPPEVRLLFRRVEKLQQKSEKLTSHLRFNETCIINQLLPTYTNVKLHDDAARTQQFVVDFRRNLINRQIEEQSQALQATETDLYQTKEELKCAASDL